MEYKTEWGGQQRNRTFRAIRNIKWSSNYFIYILYKRVIWNSRFGSDIRFQHQIPSLFFPSFIRCAIERCSNSDIRCALNMIICNIFIPIFIPSSLFYRYFYIEICRSFHCSAFGFQTRFVIGCRLSFAFWKFKWMVQIHRFSLFEKAKKDGKKHNRKNEKKTECEWMHYINTKGNRAIRISFQIPISINIRSDAFFFFFSLDSVQLSWVQFIPISLYWI